MSAVVPVSGERRSRWEGSRRLQSYCSSAHGGRPRMVRPLTTRPQPPARRHVRQPRRPPAKYLEAATRLYEKGNSALAAKYFKAAQLYRDQLSEKDQQVLDAYMAQMAKAPADGTVAPAAVAAPADGLGSPVAAESSQGVVRTPPVDPTAPAEVAPSQEVMPLAAPPAMEPAPAQASGVAPARAPVPPSITQAAVPEEATRVASIDKKSRGRWLLLTARDQLRKGDYAGAEAKVIEARSLNIRWGLFDDTPFKVSEAIAKARPKAAASADASASSGSHDRRTAKSPAEAGSCAHRQKPVRAGGGDCDRRQVVETRLQLLRRQPRQGRCRGTRTAPSRFDSKQRAARTVEPDGLRPPCARISGADGSRPVRRGRGEGFQGPADECRSRPCVRQGVRRPARPGDAQGGPGSGCRAAGGWDGRAGEPLVAEREGNDLLQKGQQAAAGAKFALAARLRAQEAVQASGGVLAATQPMTGDPTVRKATADESGAPQELPAPARSCGQPPPRPLPLPVLWSTPPRPLPLPAPANSTFPKRGPCMRAATIPAPGIWPSGPRNPRRASTLWPTS